MTLCTEMSFLLRPIVIDSESFQTGLRRRSFISSLTVVPQYLPESSSCAPEDSAVFDSDETDQCGIVTTPVESATEFVVPMLSPVTDAHMSDYESKITVPRHHHTLLMIATSDSSSPMPTSPHPAGCKLSFTALIGESKPVLVKLERLRWRLASDFFAYFICGWGDGSKLFKKQEFRRTCSFTPFLVDDTVIPCELLKLN
jgi:hypothetical protein